MSNYCPSDISNLKTNSSEFRKTTLSVTFCINLSFVTLSEKVSVEGKLHFPHSNMRFLSLPVIDMCYSFRVNQILLIELFSFKTIFVL